MSRPIKPQLRLKAYRDYLQSRRTGTDAYYLRVHLQSTRIDTEEVASHVASRLNIEPAQALSVLQTAWKVMAEANAQGFVVNTPYFRSIPMARGTLKPEELTAPIDRDRISVYAAIEQGPLLHQAMNDTQLTLFSQPAPVGPLITFVGSPPATPTANDAPSAPVRPAWWAALTSSCGARTPTWASPSPRPTTGAPSSSRPPKSCPTSRRRSTSSCRPR